MDRLPEPDLDQHSTDLDDATEVLDNQGRRWVFTIDPESFDAASASYDAWVHDSVNDRFVHTWDELVDEFGPLSLPGDGA